MKKNLKYLFLLFLPSVYIHSIEIDASLDEAEWEKAIVINEYFETVPYTLIPSEVKTETRIFSNENGIYVGFTNFQDNESMLSKKSMRDEVPNNVEQNGVAIDFDGDGLKAYMFFVTLANIQGDGIRRLGGWPQFDWDGDWEVQTKKYDGYWVSEFLIPWDVVLMKNVDGPNRSINITTFRYYAKNQSWLNDNKTSGNRTDFLSNLRTINVANYTKRKLNYFPYISKTYNSVSGFNEDKVGAEVFLNTGTGKQINLTVNPDFGQAESDEVIVNFSAQETFYSEKRAFFNENQSLFDLSHYDRYRVINTRRIGAASSYDCEASADEDSCSDAKKNYTDIAYAARYSQKVGKTEFGFLSAKENNESFSIGRDFYAIRSRTNFGIITAKKYISHYGNLRIKTYLTSIIGMTLSKFLHPKTKEQIQISSSNVSRKI